MSAGAANPRNQLVVDGDEAPGREAAEQEDRDDVDEPGLAVEREEEDIDRDEDRGADEADAGKANPAREDGRERPCRESAGAPARS